ncbi:MAG TPA: PKD domain-containing protein, partial [Chitinophagaceae bacterium]
WFWDFGNGSTSTLKNPSTSYFNPGSYTITLTVTNANGTHTTTRSNYIVVYNNPVADFSVPVSSGCSPAVLQFNDQSTTQAGTTINSWKWNFGDGGTSTQQNPQHIYRNPGSYTVSLTITTDKGCTKTVTKPYIVNVTPGVIPTFSYVDPGDCSAPSTIYFQNNSTGPGTLSYSWNLGNGVTTTSQHASTTYNTNGTYRVRLFVSSSAGCSDSVVVNVPIGKANTDFTIPASICPKTSVQFVNNSTPRPIKSLWIFPDGTTDTFANGITVFPAAGTYNVTLINTYTACTDTLVKPVTVGAGPTINFTSADTGRCQPPLTVNFTNTSNGSSYLWDFGDGTTSTQTSPTHTYNALGDYDVTLIATTGSGCIDTLKKTAFIKIRKPIITFPDLPAGGCIPFTFDFTANISSPDTAISYAWTFGDGGTSNLKNPSHTYTVAGTYNVGLTITTRTGCTETLTLADAIKVGPPPTADFTSNVTSACANPGIQFTNLSTGATQYLWEFSDGSSSTQANPLHTFIDTGWIDVTLNAINNGCTTRVVKPRYAYINPSISRFDYQPDCNNRLQYTFIDKSIQATSWVWDFGDGTSYTGQTPPVHTFPSMGTYNVSLSTSNGTCSYTLVRTITIADYTPDFSSTVTSGCKFFTPSITPS